MGWERDGCVRDCWARGEGAGPGEAEDAERRAAGDGPVGGLDGAGRRTPPGGSSSRGLATRSAPWLSLRGIADSAGRKRRDKPDGPTPPAASVRPILRETIGTPRCTGSTGRSTRWRRIDAARAAISVSIGPVAVGASTCGRCHAPSGTRTCDKPAGDDTPSRRTMPVPRPRPKLRVDRNTVPTRRRGRCPAAARGRSARCSTGTSEGDGCESMVSHLKFFGWKLVVIGVEFWPLPPNRKRVNDDPRSQPAARC